MSSVFVDPNLQVVSITDFTPGVHQFGRRTYGPLYSTETPLGSASSAFRCIVHPGIGLVPFYAYSVALAGSASSGNSPAGHPINAYILSGFGVLSSVVGPDLSGTGGPGGLGSGSLAMQSAQVDYLISTFMYADSSANVYSSGFRVASSNATTPLNQVVSFWANKAMSPPSITSFANTSQFIGGSNSFPYPMLVFTNGNVLSTAAPNSPLPYVAPVNSGVGFGSAEWQPLQTTGFFAVPSNRVIAHSGRVLALWDSNIPIQSSSLWLSGQTGVYYTDPPFNQASEAATFVSGSNLYAVEEPSGIGAWGSVSTGELLLVNRGGGALVVSGDAGFPSDINRLPAIPGTGHVTQHMAACSAGLLYVTESDGVWAWNGGNTAQKVSSQLPDNVFTILSLTNGGFAPSGFAMGGPRVQTAVIKDRVFFPHNWVFDAQTGSWWQAEDPSVIDLSFWGSSGAYTGKMYGYTMSVLAPLAAANLYGFDPTTVATSWRWVSNPIPARIVGVQPTLKEVEVSVSNPTGVTATVTITPVSLTSTSTVTRSGENAQSVTFTIPANTMGWRGTAPLGYTDYNLGVQIDASGASGAPTLHELHLGFVSTRPSAIGNV